MRSMMSLGLVFALLSGACDSERTTAIRPFRAGATPLFETSSRAASGNGSTISVLNEQYFSEVEDFYLCDGTFAEGAITWHELILQVANPNGTLVTDHLNIVDGGRATGPDGTEYIVQQVNSDIRGDAHTSFHVRIMLISPGDGQNVFFFTDRDGVWTMECRG